MVDSSASQLLPTLTLIPNLPSPTSLQVAAAAYSLSNGTALAVGGCSQQDGTNNCAAACTDLTQVFSDVRTFQNCLAFPTITQILSTINVTDEFKSTAAAYGIAMTDNVTTFNVKENIGKCLAGYCNSSPTCYEFRTPDSACYNLSMSTVTSKIFPITLDGYDYENETSFYQDANTVRSELAQNFSVSINRGTLGCIQALCENVKRTATVDTDIGGIGIYVSYFMQAGIVVLAWLLLMFWDFGLYQLTFCIKVWSHGPQGANKIARKTQARFHEHRERVTEGLIEFHKAQCFFMFAIQAAALAAKHGSFLEQTSLQQIHNNDAFIDVLSTGGFLPITFVLFALRTVGYKSVYMFILSFCTVTVSAGALLTREKFPVPDFGGTTYSDCGGANPVALCLGTNTQPADYGDYVFSRSTYEYFEFDYFQGSPDIGLSIAPLAYSLVILTLLFCELCNLQQLAIFQGMRAWTQREEWPKMKKPPWVGFPSRGFSRITSFSSLPSVDVSQIYLSKEFSSLKRLRTRYESQIAPHIQTASQSSVDFAKLTWQAGFGSPRKASCRLAELVNLVAFATFVYFMATYVNALTIFKGSVTNSGQIYNTGGIPINLKSWTFGQLVAVTVWLPPLLQYTYLEINGMQGQRWHLPKGYKVVSLKPEDEPTGSLPSFQSQKPPNAHRRSRTQKSLMRERDEDGIPIIRPPDYDSQQHHRENSIPRRQSVQASLAEESWNQ